MPAELIIVDQSNTPHPQLTALETTRSCEIRYIWNRRPGVSRARNEGIKAARHNLLVFTDDDVHVSPAWFGTLVGALCAAGERAVVTGRVLPEASSSREAGFVPSTIDDPNPAVYSGRIWTDILYSNNMALYKTSFESVGYFDERLGAGTAFKNAEDNELGFRLLEAGHRICYVPEAVVYHRAWRTWRDYHPLCWSYGYGQGAYYAKHLSLRDRYTLRRFVHDLRHRTMRALWLARTQPRRALGQLVYAGGMVIGWCSWLLTQRNTP